MMTTITLIAEASHDRIGGGGGTAASLLVAVELHHRRRNAVERRWRRRAPASSVVKAVVDRVDEGPAASRAPPAAVGVAHHGHQQPDASREDRASHRRVTAAIGLRASAPHAVSMTTARNASTTAAVFRAGSANRHHANDVATTKFPMLNAVAGWRAVRLSQHDTTISL